MIEKALAARPTSSKRSAAGSALPHTFEPRDPMEVETPHGIGLVLYVTVYGVHCNDIWCVAIKSDGRMRHYETTQLKLAFNGALGINMPNHLAPCDEEVDGAFPRRVGD